MTFIKGIGGVFFKSENPDKLRDWYKDILGLNVQEGCVSFTPEEACEDKQNYTVWAPFASDTRYFSPSEKPFMINFRVADLEAVLEHLRQHKVEVEDHVEKSEYGQFGWFMDPDGNKIELWQPPQKENDVG